MKKEKYIEFISKYFNVVKKSDGIMDVNFSFKIKKSFDFSYLEINNFDFVIAQYKGFEFSVTEFNYLKQLIESNSNYHIIFYFDKLSAQNKMSLTNYGLGYVIGTNQFFIPELSILINEKYNYKSISPDSYLSLGSQNILFKLLILDKLEIYQKGLDSLLGEEEYAVYRAIKELENKEILKIAKPHNHRVVMLDDKKTIWKNSLPFLKSPILEEKYVDKLSLFSHKVKLVPAGQYALSKVGMVVAQEEEYAIENKEYKEIADYVKPSFEGHKNAVKLQIWKTKLIEISDKLMNPFALYLSLQNDYDERIKKDYEEYIERYW